MCMHMYMCMCMHMWVSPAIQPGFSFQLYITLSAGSGKCEVQVGPGLL